MARFYGVVIVARDKSDRRATFDKHVNNFGRSLVMTERKIDKGGIQPEPRERHPCLSKVASNMNHDAPRADKLIEHCCNKRLVFEYQNVRYPSPLRHS